MTLGFASVTALALRRLADRARLACSGRRSRSSLGLAAGLSLSGTPPSIRPVRSGPSSPTGCTSRRPRCGPAASSCCSSVLPDRRRRAAASSRSSASPASRPSSSPSCSRPGSTSASCGCRSSSDLWRTGYGQVLIVKLSLVALALAWGGFHHFVVEPRLDRPGVAGRAAASSGESAVGHRRPARRRGARELEAAGAEFAASAGEQSPPARHKLGYAETGSAGGGGSAGGSDLRRQPLTIISVAPAASRIPITRTPSPIQSP